MQTALILDPKHAWCEAECCAAVQHSVVVHIHARPTLAYALLQSCTFARLCNVSKCVLKLLPPKQESQRYKPLQLINDYARRGELRSTKDAANLITELPATKPQAQGHNLANRLHRTTDTTQRDLLSRLLPILHTSLSHTLPSALHTLTTLRTTPSTPHEATWQLIPRCRCHVRRLPGKTLAAAQLGAALLSGAGNVPNLGLLSADVTRRLVALPPTVQQAPTVGVWAVVDDVSNPVDDASTLGDGVLAPLLTWYVLNTWLSDRVFQCGGDFLLLLLPPAIARGAKVGGGTQCYQCRVSMPDQNLLLAMSLDSKAECRLFAAKTPSLYREHVDVMGDGQGGPLQGAHAGSQLEHVLSTGMEATEVWAVASGQQDASPLSSAPLQGGRQQPGACVQHETKFGGEDPSSMHPLPQQLPKFGVQKGERQQSCSDDNGVEVQQQPVGKRAPAIERRLLLQTGNIPLYEASPPLAGRHHSSLDNVSDLQATTSDTRCGKQIHTVGSKAAQCHPRQQESETRSSTNSPQQPRAAAGSRSLQDDSTEAHQTGVNSFSAISPQSERPTAAALGRENEAAFYTRALVGTDLPIAGDAPTINPECNVAENATRAGREGDIRTRATLEARLQLERDPISGDQGLHVFEHHPRDHTCGQHVHTQSPVRYPNAQQQLSTQIPNSSTLAEQGPSYQHVPPGVDGNMHHMQHDAHDAGLATHRNPTHAAVSPIQPNPPSRSYSTNAIASFQTASSQTEVPRVSHQAGVPRVRSAGDVGLLGEIMVDHTRDARGHIHLDRGDERVARGVEQQPPADTHTARVAFQGAGDVARGDPRPQTESREESRCDRHGERVKVRGARECLLATLSTTQQSAPPDTPQSATSQLTSCSAQSGLGRTPDERPQTCETRASGSSPVIVSPGGTSRGRSNRRVWKAPSPLGRDAEQQHWRQHQSTQAQRGQLGGQQQQQSDVKTQQQSDVKTWQQSDVKTWQQGQQLFSQEAQQQGREQWSLQLKSQLQQNPELEQKQSSSHPQQQQQQQQRQQQQQDIQSFVEPHCIQMQQYVDQQQQQLYQVAEQQVQQVDIQEQQLHLLPLNQGLHEQEQQRQKYARQKEDQQHEPHHHGHLQRRQNEPPNPQHWQQSKQHQWSLLQTEQPQQHQPRSLLVQPQYSPQHRQHQQLGSSPSQETQQATAQTSHIASMSINQARQPPSSQSTSLIAVQNTEPELEALTLALARLEQVLLDLPAEPRMDPLTKANLLGRTCSCLAAAMQRLAAPSTRGHVGDGAGGLVLQLCESGQTTGEGHFTGGIEYQARGSETRACDACGYNGAGFESVRCKECGTEQHRKVEHGKEGGQQEVRGQAAGDEHETSRGWKGVANGAFVGGGEGAAARDGTTLQRFRYASRRNGGQEGAKHPSDEGRRVVAYAYGTQHTHRVPTISSDHVLHTDGEDHVLHTDGEEQRADSCDSALAFGGSYTVGVPPAHTQQSAIRLSSAGEATSQPVEQAKGVAMRGDEGPILQKEWQFDGASVRPSSAISSGRDSLNKSPRQSPAQCHRLGQAQEVHFTSDQQNAPQVSQLSGTFQVSAESATPSTDRDQRSRQPQHSPTIRVVQPTYAEGSPRGSKYGTGASQECVDTSGLKQPAHSIARKPAFVETMEVGQHQLQAALHAAKQIVASVVGAGHNTKESNQAGVAAPARQDEDVSVTHLKQDSVCQQAEDVRRATCGQSYESAVQLRVEGTAAEWRSSADVMLSMENVGQWDSDDDDEEDLRLMQKYGITLDSQL